MLLWIIYKWENTTKAFLMITSCRFFEKKFQFKDLYLWFAGKGAISRVFFATNFDVGLLL